MRVNLRFLFLLSLFGPSMCFGQRPYTERPRLQIQEQQLVVEHGIHRVEEWMFPRQQFYPDSLPVEIRKYDRRGQLVHKTVYENWWWSDIADDVRDMKQSSPADQEDLTREMNRVYRKWMKIGVNIRYTYNREGKLIREIHRYPRKHKRKPNIVTHTPPVDPDSVRIHDLDSLTVDAKGRVLQEHIGNYQYNRYVYGTRGRIDTIEQGGVDSYHVLSVLRYSESGLPQSREVLHDHWQGQPEGAQMINRYHFYRNRRK